MFFIAGTTGHVGGAAARRLLQQGKQVRTLARKPEKAAALAAEGVEVLQGDFSDTGALASALQGVEGAYLMMPPTLTPSPDFSEAKAVLQSFRDALQQAAPPRLVLLSSIGSEQQRDLGLITSTSLMEQALADMPFPTAFIRAASFFENYVPSLQSAAATGVFYSFYSPLDRPVPMIATKDIGDLVARLLLDDWTGKRVIELGSDHTPNEVAQAMGEALGRSVQAQAVPRDRWEGTLQSVGFPEAALAPYTQMMDSVNSGWIHFGVPGTEHVAGTTALAEVFRSAGSR